MRLGSIDDDDRPAKLEKLDDPLPRLDNASPILLYSLKMKGETLMRKLGRPMKFLSVAFAGFMASSLYATNAQADFVKITNPKIAGNPVSVCLKDRNYPTNCSSTSQKRVADRICISKGHVRAKDWKKGFVAIPSPMQLLTKRLDGKWEWQNATRMDPFSWVYCESIYTEYDKPIIGNSRIDKCFEGMDWGNSTKRCDSSAQRYIARKYCIRKGHTDVKSWKTEMHSGSHAFYYLNRADYLSGKKAWGNPWSTFLGVHAFSQIVCQ